MEFHVHQSEDAIYKIYKLTGPRGKIYIGCTRQNVKNRWMNGRGYKHNKALDSDIKLYGWDAFEKKILCDKLLKEAAEQLEDKFIRYYDSRNQEKGYNYYTGGAREGAKLSALGLQHCVEATYERWSRSEYIAKQQEEGRKRYAGNPEMCSKISKAIKKAYETDPGIRKRHSESLRAYYAKGNKPELKPKACQCVETGITYASLRAADKDTGAHHSLISRCCKGERLTAGGYHWRYAEREEAAES